MYSTRFFSLFQNCTPLLRHLYLSFFSCFIFLFLFVCLCDGQALILLTEKSAPPWKTRVVQLTFELKLIQRAFQMLFFVANSSFSTCLKGVTMTDPFPRPPIYVLREFSFGPLEEQSSGQSWKGGFCALSKLVYFKTQLLELVESPMEALKHCLPRQAPKPPDSLKKLRRNANFLLVLAVENKYYPEESMVQNIACYGGRLVRV